MVVVGMVGSGKTTLLHSIMEETQIQKGKQTVKGTIAYVEQEPFIYSTSIKENILLGKVYNEELFQKALQASQLVNDIENFKGGADTVIGERGINISGGQKARISLARAVYSEADIYLLDDPLSAVDPQVASDIFHNCICGVLKDKLVILVTHQLQFLTSCNKILVIKDGKQHAVGDFETITKTGFNIEEILQSYNESMNKNKKGEGKEAKFTAETKQIVKSLAKAASSAGLELSLTKQ